jgi:hypothetical protein
MWLGAEKHINFSSYLSCAAFLAATSDEMIMIRLGIIYILQQAKPLSFLAI